MAGDTARLRFGELPQQLDKEHESLQEENRRLREQLRRGSSGGALSSEASSKAVPAPASTSNCISLSSPTAFEIHDSWNDASNNGVTALEADDELDLDLGLDDGQEVPRIDEVALAHYGVWVHAGGWVLCRQPELHVANGLGSRRLVVYRLRYGIDPNGVL